MTARHWLLPFASQENGGNGPAEGRPWADGTVIAGRDGNGVPWDEGCRVTPLLGGHRAMTAIRDCLERAIACATAMPETIPPGRRGHVYIGLWRFSPQRDLSEDNGWGLAPWSPGQRPACDQTALGLILRLMQAGVRVRVLLWYPAVSTDFIVGAAHREEHLYVARAVRAWNDRLCMGRRSSGEALGVVGLDLRVAESVPAAAQQQPQLHQKVLVVRVGEVEEAHCGGMDFGFTRRDAPMMCGDWQSGVDVPAPTDRWPGWDAYPGLDAIPPPVSRHAGDLPPEVYGERRQIWNDQHVKLEGPVVATMEEYFRRRWTDQGRVHLLDTDGAGPHGWRVGDVVISTPTAVRSGRIVSLPPARPVDPAGAAAVQMWHTIPWRAGRRGGPLARGEYTAMAGIAQACQCSGELIWMFDQYFWHRPLARLLNRLLRERAGLCVLLVLPPHAGGGSLAQPAARTVQAVHHHARRLALGDLTAGLGPHALARVGVYNTWQHDEPSRGVYCHAKAHTYDGSLLVCGSTNLNWRSFTRDLETTAAVYDPAAVRVHQRALWDWLLRGASWPIGSDGCALDLDQPGAGARFLDAFHAQASRSSFLIPDRWDTGVHVLPNGVVRRDDVSGAAVPDTLLRLTDPNALPGAAESDDADGLDDLVRRMAERRPLGGLV